MSYRSRQKKRAITKAKTQHRAVIAGRHYLTLVVRKCACNGCRGLLREGRECVYRRTPREVLCVECAIKRRLPYRPSLRWEKDRRRRAA